MSDREAIRLAGRPRRVLVVDDIEFVRHMLRELLVFGGYEVEVAANAAEAMKLAEQVRWDGLVLDVDMPGMNGIDLYGRILRRYGGRCLPVLFFTGRPNEALELSLATVPWARLVAKPCAGHQLLSLLEQCMQAAGR